jgi:hypothetical protein
MRRVIVIAAASLSLAGCSSFSFGDYFKSTPPIVQVQLDSQPQGADASTSIGPGCKTPCSVTITPPEDGGFSVSYTLNKFQPATVPVQVTRVPGSLTTSATTNIDPNPVFAQLQPAGPPPRPPRRHLRPRRPKPPPAAAGAPAPADGAFPAPAPAASAPPPPPPGHN